MARLREYEIKRTINSKCKGLDWSSGKKLHTEEYDAFIENICYPLAGTLLIW